MTFPQKFKFENHQLVSNSVPDGLTRDPVYLEVTQDASLVYVSGIVKNQSGETFIANALILIGNDTTVTTDSCGIFKITLPAQMRVKDEYSPYILHIKKTGYTPRMEYYYPKSTPIEIRLREQTRNGKGR